MSLGYSSISHANQILQPNIAGGANPSGGHFVDPGPQYSSLVGGVTGCGGAGSSAAALAGKPGYNIVAKQSGGKTHRRGGYHKHGKSKKRRCTCRGKCRRRGRCHCRRRRTMRGGYHQYMTNVPASNNFRVGGSLSPAMSGMANPAPITVFPNCPTK